MTDPQGNLQLEASAQDTEEMVSEDVVRNSKPTGKRKLQERPCLRCGSLFLSEWMGHRVCQHCKSSSTWRSGVQQTPQSSRSKR